MKNVKVYFNFYLLAVVILASFFVVKATNSAGKVSQLAKNLTGKILIQVEENGEAWYVNPQTQERSFLGRPEDAFKVMREEAVGITSSNLSKIPVSLEHIIDKDSDGDKLSDDFEKAIGTDPSKKDTDGDGFDDHAELLNSYDPVKSNGAKLNYDNNFANKQKGKIFLDVERNGEAWYVNPDDGKRYFLGRPSDAFELMRRKGLGITNANLNQIREKNQGQASNQADNQQENAGSSAVSGDLFGDFKNKLLSCESRAEGFYSIETEADVFGVSFNSKTDNKVNIIEGSIEECRIGLETTSKEFSIKNLDQFIGENITEVRNDLAVNSGKSQETIDSLINSSIGRLSEEDKKIFTDNGMKADIFAVKNNSITLRDVMYQSAADSLDNFAKEYQSMETIKYICTGKSEALLDYLTFFITKDGDISASVEMSGSEVITTYTNGVACKSDIVMTKNDN